MDRIEPDTKADDDRIALKLGGPDAGGPAAAGTVPGDEPKPVVGWIAVGLGLIGLFMTIFAIPFSIAFSVAALFVGQTAWGIGGLVLSVLAIVTSPTIVALLGIGAFLAMFGL